ncbi:hypothetical protein ACFQV4_37565 [Streptomyces thermocarboxydus]
MTPPPERAELAAALREMRQRTGLSLTGLEERTPTASPPGAAI